MMICPSSLIFENDKVKGDFIMSIKTLSTRVIHKHDTEENWLKAVNFSPLNGELIIYNPDSNHEYARFKVGDGTTNVNDLPFVVNEEEIRTALESKANDSLDNVDNIVFYNKAKTARVGNIVVNATLNDDQTAFNATVPEITELYVGLELIIIPNISVPSNLSYRLGLNVNNLGIKEICCRDGHAAGSASNYVPYNPLKMTWMHSNVPTKVTYNGSAWLVDMQTIEAGDIRGTFGISQGGTGATTRTGVRTSLGISSVEFETTLLSSNWLSTITNKGMAQVIEHESITSTSPIELLPGSNVTAEQLKALQAANIIGNAQNTGTIQLLILTGTGKVPTIDIPVRLIIRGDL